MTIHPVHALADLVRQARSIPDFARYRRLQEQFGFNAWHVKSPFARRPYKRRVVAMVESFAPETVVEIGCGLGEILARTSARHRFGFDQEAAVVAAAAHLHASVASFHTGDLNRPEEIAQIVNRPIDVLVAVNWPHILPMDDIVNGLSGLAAHVPVSILIIDTIRPERAGYEHYHTRADIERLGTIVASMLGGDLIRDLHAVRLKHA